MTPRAFAAAATLLLASNGFAAEPKTFEIENNALKLPGPIAFEAGSDKLAASSNLALEHIKAYLDDKSYITLARIEAHVDASGKAADNQALTGKRAMAVAKWLVAKGVDCKRLMPVGFGDTKPMASNSTPEGKAQNRRILMVNAMLKGRAIGGMPVDGGGVVAGDPCK